MVNPKFVEEEAVTIVDLKDIITKIEKRDKELNYRSNKTKEFLDHFASNLPKSKKEELEKKLKDLNLTRLKYEHIVKIIDFLPKDTEELKAILLSYPLSLPKKDQEAILAAVKDFL